jgi:protocatechuate 3,4-dioxygenase beta subunit
MVDDDSTIGRVLTRREVLALVAAAGAAPFAGIDLRAQALPGCVVVPAQTEGPYFVDAKLNRTDIRSDPSTKKAVEGTPLDLSIKVFQLSGATACAPLAGAIVDVWQCDALGEYSDVADRKIGFDTRGRQFLRGYQTTDGAGLVRFTTVYPGWYPGRTVHIHFKIRTDPSATRGREFTSQLYFDDGLTDKVHSRPPYNTKGQRRTTNANDGIYRNGGKQLMLKITPDSTAYQAAFELALTQ